MLEELLAENEKAMAGRVWWASPEHISSASGQREMGKLNSFFILIFSCSFLATFLQLFVFSWSSLYKTFLLYLWYTYIIAMAVLITIIIEKICLIENYILSFFRIFYFVSSFSCLPRITAHECFVQFIKEISY